MQPKTLRVRAVAAVLVPRFDLENVRRFVGRTAGEPTEDGVPWIPDDEPAVIPNMSEYREALKHGELAAADEATAKAAGVKYVPAPLETKRETPAAKSDAAGKVG